MITRRSFITATIGILAAPAIVRASSLMPVKAWAEERDYGTYFLNQGRLWFKSDTSDHLIEITRHRGSETVWSWTAPYPGVLRP